MADATPKQIEENIETCMVSDRFPLKNKLLRVLKQAGSDSYKASLNTLNTRLQKSQALSKQRSDTLPTIHYPEALPISQKREEIAEAIKNNQVVILAGETGSGKTTQIPKICLDIGRGVYGMIGHTQPRRLAARTVAARVAEELNVSLGEQVGYQVRFSDHSNKLTHIKLMTDGILLAETQHDRFLNRYDTLIIDEAHERSLNIDFLLGYLKQLLPKRPDLKLIITSATIDLERFSKHFSNAPIIEVSGRTYPVEVIHQPLTELDEGKKAGQDDGLIAGIVSAVDTIRSFPRPTGASDILVFLSGEKEIRDVAKALKEQHYRHTEVLPLYARLSNAEQNKVFQSHSGQRIVLATNVAETSITVPGIRYVIDPGLARISRYSVRSKVQRLPIEAISQASANQRKGRCGRIADGVCIRLYDEDDFNNRSVFTDPEIARTNLASVILQMLHLRLGDVVDFPFVDKPDSRSIKDGYQLLLELGAVNSQMRMTSLGRQLAKFPLDPRIARMIIASAEMGSLKEVLIIASALTIQDPRERPHEKQQAADEKHRAYADEASDFISLINLWESIEEQRQALTQNQFRKYCRRHFLSYLRIREWRETHRQLLLLCKELSFKQKQEAADYGAIHRALLTGLLGYIGEKHENNEYRGTRNRRFSIFPGSALFKKTPKWLMAAEVVETSRLYARTVAQIDPAWVEPLAATLVKRNHFEPHWEKKRGQVIAFEQISLYGLVVVNRRRVDFGKIDEKEAREIFIRSALVENQLETKAPFYLHNQKLVADIESLEHKSRRRDILVDDEIIYQFYDEQLPEHIHSSRTLSSWQKQQQQSKKERLHLTREYLMQNSAAHVSDTQFPNEWRCEDMRLELSYQFNIGSEQDGVSLKVPLGLLNQISANRIQWLVPGMLRDKCIALVKALPKSIRKHFVPVPNYVDRALEEMAVSDEPLTASLAHALKRVTGFEVLSNEWDESTLDNFHLMNICVIDEKGDVLEQGRDLLQLRQQFKQRIGKSLKRANRSIAFERENITQWDFGSLDREIEIEQGGMKLKAYPALIEKDGTAALELADTQAKAKALSNSGVRRLLMLATPQQKKYLGKQIPKLQEMSLYYTRMGTKQELLEGLVQATYQRTFLDDSPMPVDESDFNHLVSTRKADLVSTANETAELMYRILQEHHEIAKQINGNVPLHSVFVYADIKFQLSQLFQTGFMVEVSWEHLQQYPRYLKGIQIRLEKIQDQLQREKLWCAELDGYWQRYDALQKRYKSLAVDEAPLERLRWIFEEYRVSLYAQTLGTSEPVSGKRIEKLFGQLQP